MLPWMIVPMGHIAFYCVHMANPDGWAVCGVVMSTRWWLLVDHCVLRNWDRILVRAVKGLISRAGMVSICPLLWQRDVKLPTNQNCVHMWRGLCMHFRCWLKFLVKVSYWFKGYLILQKHFRWTVWMLNFDIITNLD